MMMYICTSTHIYIYIHLYKYMRDPARNPYPSRFKWDYNKNTRAHPCNEIIRKSWTSYLPKQRCKKAHVFHFRTNSEEQGRASFSPKLEGRRVRVPFFIEYTTKGYAYQFSHTSKQKGYAYTFSRTSQQKSTRIHAHPTHEHDQGARTNCPALAGEKRARASLLNKFINKKTSRSFSSRI